MNPFSEVDELMPIRNWLRHLELVLEWEFKYKS